MGFKGIGKSTAMEATELVTGKAGMLAHTGLHSSQ